MSLLILTFSSQAAPLCSKNGTTVIYTNGVTTSRDEANIALGKIKALALNSHIDLKPEKVLYDLAYNDTESLSLDVMESAVQKLPQSYIDMLKVTNAYAAYSDFLQGKLISSIGPSIINSIIQAKLELIRSFAIDYHNDLFTLKL